MPYTPKEKGVEMHYLRSFARLGAYAVCGRVILDDHYTTIWKDVTCGNCKLCRPKWERDHGEQEKLS